MVSKARNPTIGQWNKDPQDFITMSHQTAEEEP